MYIIVILIYIVLLLFTYIVVTKRLKYLNEKHIKQIGAKCLRRKNKILLRWTLFLFLILGFVGSVIIMDFFNQI